MDRRIHRVCIGYLLLGERMTADRFRYFLRVRYGECDAQKVVFNARYADYVDLATAEFLRSMGYEKELQTGELDYQLVKQTIEWRAPARYDCRHTRASLDASNRRADAIWRLHHPRVKQKTFPF